MDKLYEIFNEPHDRKTDSDCFADLQAFQKAFSEMLLVQEGSANLSTNKVCNNIVSVKGK